MALERKTTWSCDVCDAKIIVNSSNDSEGLRLPSRWAERIIAISTEYKDDWCNRKVLMCDDCFDDFKGLYSFKPEHKVILKKSFWQKLLGRTK